MLAKTINITNLSTNTMWFNNESRNHTKTSTLTYMTLPGYVVILNKYTLLGTSSGHVNAGVIIIKN